MSTGTPKGGSKSPPPSGSSSPESPYNQKSSPPSCGSSVASTIAPPAASSSSASIWSPASIQPGMEMMQSNSQCMQRSSSYMTQHPAYPTNPQQYAAPSYYSEYLPPMQLPMMSHANGGISAAPSMYSSPALHSQYPRVTSDTEQLSPRQATPNQNGGIPNVVDTWSKYDANKFQVLWKHSRM